MIKAFLFSIFVAIVLGTGLGILSAILELSETSRHILGLTAGIGVYMSIMSPAINEYHNKKDKDDG